MAPMARPRTRDRCAIQPTMITGTEATVAAADRCAMYSPSWGTELIRNIGIVAAFVIARLTARNSSFQAKITQISAVDTKPGATTGMMTSVISRIGPAPSSRAASSVSAGTSSMNERIIQIASGRFIAAYKMISSQMLSSRCACRASTYSGPIAATIGSILVEMKKNSPSCHRFTGRTDSPYAAGSARISTRAVETSVAIAGWVIYGPMPLNTIRNSDSVGLKVNFGGHVSAADSGLNAVTTIHGTGRKMTSPITHAPPLSPTGPATGAPAAIRDARPTPGS